MTHLKRSAALALLLALTPGAWAAGGGDLSLGLDSKAGDFSNAKYNEYRNNDRAFRLLGAASASFLDEDKRLRFGLDLSGADLSGENWAYGSGDLGLNLELGGILGLELDWSHLGHNFVEGAPFAFDPATAGSERLVLSPGAKAALTGATPATVTGVMGGVTGSGNTVNAGLDRQRFKAGLELYAAEHSTLSLSLDSELRNGSRPLGQSVDGTSVSIEVLEPINYQTTDLGLSYVYDRDWLVSELSYHRRQFQNYNSGLAFENPFNAGGVDKNGVAAVGGGAVLAQCSLPPSNTADSYAADLIVKAPLGIRLEGLGSYSNYNQNVTFLPFTTNTALYAAATAAGALAQPTSASLNGNVASINGAVKAQWDPIKSLRVKAASEYWEHDNRSSAVQTDAAYKNADYNSSGSIKFYPVYENWVESKNSAGASLRFLSSQLGGSYWHDVKGITGGMSDNLTEDGGKLDLDTQALHWLGLRLSGERSSRESAYYPIGNPTTKTTNPSNIAGASGDLTLARMYYQAARDRDAGSAKLNLLLGQSASASLGYTLAHDYYRDTAFGLLDDSDQSLSADLDWELLSWLSLNPSYIYEQRIGTQRSDGNFNVANMSNPLVDPNAWTGTNFESVQTIALSMSLTPWERLALTLGGTYTQVHGQMAYVSNGTYAPNDIVLDQNNSLSFDTRARVKVAEGLHLSAGYQYATFSYNSYLTDGQPNFNTNNGAANPPTRFLLVLDSQPVSYTVQTLMASADYSF